MEREGLKIDWTSIILWGLFVLLGWLNIYAATSLNAGPDAFIFDISYDFGKQLFWIAIAGILGFIVLILDNRLVEISSYVLYGAGILLLILVLLIGKEVNGSKSWLTLGPLRLQPSEFMKLFTAMAVAKFMSRFNFSFKSWTNRLGVASLIGLPTLLVVLQKDTGTALVFMSFIFMLLREGLNPLYFILFSLVIVFSVMALIIHKLLVITIIAFLAWLSYFFAFRSRYKIIHLILAASLSGVVLSVDYIVNHILRPHQRNRIIALFNPEIDPLGLNWNTTQSKIAIGSGGFWGKGFLNGNRTKYHFVPQQATDFIFCTVGEEYGWVGSVLLLVLFFAFLAQILFLAENARSTYARVFGYSIASIFFFHIAVNIAMTIGLAPVIGIPLPFFSYGGSSLISFTLMLFVLLNFYANR
ncbi:MAG: rod shape-determining protein RodA [Bacteroidia bacterium]|nr:rod shape-determining protein RodA [Bacteroidia bacterium]MDW8158476.1 rod shape-determining protein RodA [Bacteroidia bacterium]